MSVFGVILVVFPHIPSEYFNRYTNQSYANQSILRDTLRDT